jgi:hypothetical protein
MTGAIEQVLRGVSHYRIAIAIGVPVLGGLLALAASLLTPRGKLRGAITGAYLLLAALGCSFLLFAVAGLIVGAPRDLLMPLFVPGIALAVVMGLFAPVVIREYQHFEFRKLAAELFRRS